MICGWLNLWMLNRRFGGTIYMEELMWRADCNLYVDFNCRRMVTPSFCIVQGSATYCHKYTAWKALPTAMDLPAPSLLSKSVLKFIIITRDLFSPKYLKIAPPFGQYLNLYPIIFKVIISSTPEYFESKRVCF